MSKKDKNQLEGLGIGRIVHYHKDVGTVSGSKLMTYAAIVLEMADPVSNFKSSDGAVTLQVFTCAKGGNNEVKHNVMFSETPMNGRWTWPAKQ